MKNLGKNYEEAKAYTDYEKLPVGGYVLKIQNIRYDEGKDGKSDVIVFAFDIEEGNEKGFYQRNYDAQTQEDKKWKGTFRLYVPKDDGSEQDNWTMRRFKTVMADFEESNSGYKWEWNESTLKGKLIGGLFREREYNFNGRTGFFTECCGFTKVSAIREGTFKLPATKYLNGKKSPAQSSDEGFMNVPEDSEDEIPF